MADDTDKQPQAEDAKKGGKSPIVIAAVAGLMIAEAAALFVVMKMTGASSSTAAEVDLAGDDENNPERLVELQLVEGRFFNASTGRPFTYQTQIFVKVRQKNLERIERDLERRNAEIREGVAKIFAAAQQRHLMFEPGRETIKRQLTALAEEIFGSADGVPRIEEVLIPTLDGAPLDY